MVQRLKAKVFQWAWFKLKISNNCMNKTIILYLQDPVQQMVLISDLYTRYECTISVFCCFLLFFSVCLDKVVIILITHRVHYKSFLHRQKLGKYHIPFLKRQDSEFQEVF